MQPKALICNPWLKFDSVHTANNSNVCIWDDVEYNCCDSSDRDNCYRWKVWYIFQINFVLCSDVIIYFILMAFILLMINLG